MIIPMSVPTLRTTGHDPERHRFDDRSGHVVVLEECERDHGERSGPQVVIDLGENVLPRVERVTLPRDVDLDLQTEHRRVELPVTPERPATGAPDDVGHVHVVHTVRNLPQVVIPPRLTVGRVDLAAGADGLPGRGVDQVHD